MLFGPDKLTNIVADNPSEAFWRIITSDAITAKQYSGS